VFCVQPAQFVHTLKVLSIRLKVIIILLDKEHTKNKEWGLSSVMWYVYGDFSHTLLVLHAVLGMHKQNIRIQTTIQFLVQLGEHTGISRHCCPSSNWGRCLSLYSHRRNDTRNEAVYGSQL